MHVAFDGMGNAELLSRVQGLVRADRSVCAELLVHLAEVDARGLALEQAYSSLHEYCAKELLMSDAVAALRVYAARLVRKYPVMIARIEAGELNLTSIRLIGPHLTLANHVELFDRARGKSKREVEKLVAEIAPRPDVPARTRRLPEPSRPAKTAQPDAPVVPPAAVSQPLDSQQSSSPPSASGTFALEHPRRRASIKPLSARRYKLELTLDQEGYDCLDELRELLRHQIPDGDLARIVTLALGLLRDKKRKQRCAQTSAPSKRPDAPKKREDVPEHVAEAPKKPADASEKPGRHVPRAVVREVYARDGGRCTFVSESGQRCAARGFIELHHHDVTFARGGAATVDNLRLACRSHNALLAARDHGADYMRRRVQSSMAQRLDRKAESSRAQQ